MSSRLFTITHNSLQGLCVFSMEISPSRWHENSETSAEVCSGIPLNCSCTKVSLTPDDMKNHVCQVLLRFCSWVGWDGWRNWADILSGRAPPRPHIYEVEHLQPFQGLQWRELYREWTWKRRCHECFCCRHDNKSWDQTVRLRSKIQSGSAAAAATAHRTAPEPCGSAPLSSPAGGGSPN